MGEGIRRFNEGKFFEAHEAWERAWKKVAETSEKHFLQGMIMIAAALHHHTRKESAGAAKLLRRGLHILTTYKEASILIDREDFLQSVTLFYEHFRSGRELLSEEDFPKIRRCTEDQNAS
jgi:predicted metal-dependent hydrolase